MNPVIYRVARNWKQNLWAKSNDNNYLLECPIEYRNIETVEIENKSFEQIQTTITFYSDVQLGPVTYRDAPNWKQKLWANWNDNYFILGCPNESRNISRHS